MPSSTVYTYLCGCCASKSVFLTITSAQSTDTIPFAVTLQFSIFIIGVVVVPYFSLPYIWNAAPDSVLYVSTLHPFTFNSSEPNASIYMQCSPLYKSPSFLKLELWLLSRLMSC